MQARQSLQVKQSLSLVMTQQLQQSIKLLQMNAHELQTFIEEELIKNPFLEDGEEAPDKPDAQEQTENEQGQSESSDEFAAEPAQAVEPISGEWEQDLAQDNNENWEYEPSERIQVSTRNHHGEELEFEDSRADAPSLHEHLRTQALLQLHAETERRIAMHLIDSVDEAGYMREDLAKLSTQLGLKQAQIEKVLFALQTMEPVGICARDLKECLSLQLKDRNRLDPAMETLLDNLPLLANAQLDQLKRKCAVDEEDLRGMIADIRALNPKPGLMFQYEVVETAAPDVIMRKDAGKWHIELNTSTLPRVLVNRRYYSEISMTSKGIDKKYLSEQMNVANWLIKALDQRAHTILKVATDIVAQQDSFFKLGIHHLKPLTLKDIAAATGFHESTVSRVTTGKYIMTPRGLFELKYFFTSGLNHSAGGDNVSSETVRHLIKDLIDKENPKAVLSDDEIADSLKAKNINVARRTVAKYREGLHIPSSTLRRRQKLVAC